MSAPYDGVRARLGPAPLSRFENDIPAEVAVHGRRWADPDGFVGEGHLPTNGVTYHT